PTGGVWSKTGVMSISVGGACATGPSAGPFSVSYTVTNSNGCTNARTIAGNVVLCPARGITNNSVMTSDNNFTMYPNPANNVVKIDINKLVGNGQIIVTDMLGKQVVKQSLSIGMNNVDISKLTKGFYMVSIVTSEGKTTKKLIKE
ncbi:MAG: T9SS type A sorting domain-containing protein, partial [Bacteroidetes bacterium]|nr:T9SS type A sorting domain-containing protein [Bacteroidota bacterium]